jgi:hypothetical protein
VAKLSAAACNRHPPGGEAGHPLALQRPFAAAPRASARRAAAHRIAPIDVIGPGDALLIFGARLPGVSGPAAGSSSASASLRAVVDDQRLDERLELGRERIALDAAGRSRRGWLALPDQLLRLRE